MTRPIKQTDSPRNEASAAVQLAAAVTLAPVYVGGSVANRADALLRLDRNEGQLCVDAARATLRDMPIETLQRYPSSASLERALADSINIDPERVVLTAGGDDAIDRLVRATVEPGRDALAHAPTFEMIERSVRLAGGRVLRVSWLDGPFPLDDMVHAIDERVGCVALVSPNNPTGFSIDTRDLVRAAEAAAAVRALALVDLAYVEFADEDPTDALLELPNVAIVRTFSKAWGLAGLRVGWLAASVEVARAARALGGPFDVAGPSIALAAHALATGATAMRANVLQAQRERSRLASLLNELGAHACAGQANFVLARFADAACARSAFVALAEIGVIVRDFPLESALANALRITCPSNEAEYERLANALREALPSAIAKRRGEQA